MDWFRRLSGIPEDNMLNISISSEKLIQNIKSHLLQMRLRNEMSNIDDIVYLAIFRDKVIGHYTDELHIIEVVLREPKYVKTIAEAFQRTIAYQQIIIFSSGEKYLLFRSCDAKEAIREWQFSAWVYEEELSVDFSLGTERNRTELFSTNDSSKWWNFEEQLYNLFSNAQFSEFICMRHLTDMLKIREMETGRKYVQPVIRQLAREDKIVRFNDSPFVLKTRANGMYNEHNHRYSFGGVVDERVGIDKYFEPLREGDFTTFDEMQSILNQAEYFLIYEGSESYDDIETPNWMDDDDDSQYPSSCLDRYSDSDYSKDIVSYWTPSITANISEEISSYEKFAADDFEYDEVEDDEWDDDYE